MKLFWPGIAALSLIVLAAIIGTWLTPYDPAGFAVRLRFAAPTFLHPFGTDEFGRDVLSRVLSGAHLSLLIGFGAMLVSLVGGVRWGCSPRSTAVGAAHWCCAWLICCCRYRRFCWAC